MAELPNTEFKSTLDLREKKDQLRLVAEVIAMANAEGGVIRIGVDDDGNEVGVDARTAATFDPANVANLVDSFLGTDHVEVTVHRRHLNSEHLIVDLVIEKFPTPPLVICKEGNHQSEKGQKCEFRKGDVLVRRGTRASRATRSDYLAWTEAACDSARRLLMDRVSFVSTLPPEAELSVAIGEVDLTEPAAMLSHASRAWTAEPTRLLGPSELAWLLVGEGELGDLGDVAARLLFQSALRKNATLYHWLARIQPTAEWIERSVHEAMTARDRDRTDAGRAIVAVSALTLDSDAYGRVIAELSASRYKHFREAGAAVRQQDEIDRLRETVRSPMKGEALASLSDGELTARSTAEAQQLLDGSNLAVSRRLIRLGLERFSRTAAGGRLAYDRG